MAPAVQSHTKDAGEALQDIHYFITAANTAPPGSGALHWSRQTASSVVGCFTALEAVLAAQQQQQQQHVSSPALPQLASAAIVSLSATGVAEPPHAPAAGVVAAATAAAESAARTAASTGVTPAAASPNAATAGVDMVHNHQHQHQQQQQPANAGAVPAGPWATLQDLLLARAALVQLARLLVVVLASGQQELEACAQQLKQGAAGSAAGSEPGWGRLAALAAAAR
jgi:hypothetical protein